MCRTNSIILTGVLETRIRVIDWGHRFGQIDHLQGLAHPALGFRGHSYPDQGIECSQDGRGFVLEVEHGRARVGRVTSSGAQVKGHVVEVEVSDTVFDLCKRSKGQTGQIVFRPYFKFIYF